MSKKKQPINTDEVISELNESAFFHAPQPTSTQVDKPPKPPVFKYTTHLPRETIKAIKRYALEHDRKDYEIVLEAIEAFLQAHTDEQKTPSE